MEKDKHYKLKMLLAADKTQYITFRHQSKRKFPKMQLTLKQPNLKECDHVKYLGLFLDHHMTYSKHVYGKAARKLGYLTYLYSYKGVRPSLFTYNLLYKTIIRPSLEYASAFWNGAADIHKKQLERIQRIAMCRILGVMKFFNFASFNLQETQSTILITKKKKKKSKPPSPIIKDQLK
ncbi:hypothetical protein RFI_00595 [Reticulomyxa filosa]|uniref:Uncharacterized protein n=1 Tax=Reticulomyxa filosa TaxID=46433 RepID=X6PFL5_RETFI|nr:hypothetical protein RFI_00595 [Reticulomyxa filosa]|eukprot:ETO36467.1 hypothetical protein RFI_00595 [Reticulomyxa filosa]